MKRFVDVVQYVVLAGTVVFLLALFVNEPTTPATGGDATTAGAGAGSTIYRDNCAACHGSEGSGGVGPALGGGAVVESIPDPADQVVVITDGRNGMPAFGGRLTPEEIRTVTDYTRNDL
jgi:mono/diheme cytochrome c family protein